jgi:alkanesulfonate monooxygenase SsuD/methylene tetrahydromethanopterin reductase-like flavin-dependent oxidoreductase (luciferase family)
MFRGERFSLAGKHYTIENALGLPRPVQDPHPPIMIGGTGEKVLLRIVARHADMWNASGSAERMRELIDIIRRHGDAVGRDTGRIEKSVMMPLCYSAGSEREGFVTQIVAAMQQCSPEEARLRIMIGSKSECLDTVARYRAAGVTHFIFMLFQPVFVDEVQAFAEDVAPAARG